MSIPLGFDLDLREAAGGCLVVAVHSSSVTFSDGAGVQLAAQAVLRGCDVDDEQDFSGPDIFRVELGQADPGDAIAIQLSQELDGVGRLFLDLSQADVVPASQSIELSVWIRKRAGEHES